MVINFNKELIGSPIIFQTFTTKSEAKKLSLETDLQLSKIYQYLPRFARITIFRFTTWFLKNNTA